MGKKSAAGPKQQQKQGEAAPPADAGLPAFVRPLPGGGCTIAVHAKPGAKVG